MRSRSIHAILLAGCLTWASTSYAEDLMTIVQRTLSYDAEVGQARADYDAARQAIPIARAGLLPQVSGGWARAYNAIKTDDFPSQHYWQSGWTVQATQPLLDWSKWTAYQQADYVAALGTVKLAAAQQAAMLRAVRVYFDELAAEDEVTRAREYLAAIDAQRNRVRKLRAAGEATLIDERDVDLAYDQAQIQSNDAEQDRAVRRRRVQQTSGEPFVSLTGLSRATPVPVMSPESADVWADRARADAYGVQSTRFDWEIAKMESKKTRAGHYPVVALTGSYTPAGAASGYSRPTTTTTAMLQVTIPIFSGGETQARLKQSLALEDKARMALESASLQAEGAARDSFAAYIKARMRANALAALDTASLDALDATEQGFKAGSRTQTDIVRALDTMYSIRRDSMQARYQAITSLLQLKGDVAALDLEDIERVNVLLEPMKSAD
jgi:outer membrane protein